MSQQDAELLQHGGNATRDLVLRAVPPLDVGVAPPRSHASHTGRLGLSPARPLFFGGIVPSPEPSQQFQAIERQPFSCSAGFLKNSLSRTEHVAFGPSVK